MSKKPTIRKMIDIEKEIIKGIHALRVGKDPVRKKEKEVPLAVQRPTSTR